MLLQTKYIKPIYDTDKVVEATTLSVRYQLNFSPWDGNVCFFLGAEEPEKFNYMKHTYKINATVKKLIGQFPFRPYQMKPSVMDTKQLIPEIKYNIENSKDSFFTDLIRSISIHGVLDPIPVCKFDTSFEWNSVFYKKDLYYLGNIGNSRLAVCKYLGIKQVPVTIWVFGATNEELLLNLARSE